MVNPIKKVYGYITRLKDHKVQVLVFQHSNPEAGIQVPKGTVEAEEGIVNALIREMKEETGLSFHYFWISSKNDIELVRGHADYLDLIF